MTDKNVTPAPSLDMTDLSGFNLADAQNTPQTLELTHPLTGETLMSNGKPMTIRLLGAKSKEFRAALNNAARLEQAKRIKPVPSIEADEQRSAKMLAAATVGWDNIVVGGEQLAFSKETAAKLYLDYDWIRTQVDGFVADAANFWKAPETN